MEKKTRRMMNRVLLFTLLALLLSACALAPGMRMHTGRMKHNESVDVEAARQQFQRLIRFEPITADLIAHQFSASVAKPLSYPELTASDAKYRYLIAPHDILQITVWGHPELTMPDVQLQSPSDQLSAPTAQLQSPSDQGVLVHKDGTIFFPYVGVVKVAGMTVEAVRQMISNRLASIVENPQVDVRVAAFRGRKVYVTGEVTKPGEVALTDVPMHILDALDSVGGVGGLGLNSLTRSVQFGFQREADLQHVTLTRNGKTYPVDVLALLKGGNLDQNYLLQDGDIVHVPDNTWNKVFVLGEVNQPSSMMIHDGSMTLAEALGDAKGVDMATVDAGHIYVIRGGNIVADGGGKGWRFKKGVKPTVYELDASSPDALILADQFRLHARDIVFVSTAPVVMWGRVLNQLGTSMQAIAIGRALTK